MEQYREQEPQAPILQMCQSLKVSRSWFYERPAHREPTAEELNLRDEIEKIALEFSGYGYRSMTQELRRRGWTVNHKRVLGLMRQECLLCRLQKGFVVTTNSDHAYRTYSNRLKDTALTAPNQAWVADITYIRLPTCFCYLACLLDAYSRVCVGWHLSRQIDAQLALMALQKAIQWREPPAGLIHHSDRGVQYASCAYIECLEQHGLVPSMSAKGNPYDNAKAESFFKTLKRDEVSLKDYRSYDEAQQNLAVFIDQVYNQKRLHSSLGYLPPLEFETQYYQQRSAAA